MNTQDYREFLLSSGELQHLQELFKLLEPFNSLSRILRGDKYVTAALEILVFQKFPKFFFLFSTQDSISPKF